MKLKVVVLTAIFTFIPFCSFQSCNHHHNSTFLNCSSLGFLNVPKNLPVSTTRLDLSSNNITTLHNNDFSELINLQYLDLSLNSISLIQVNAFNGLQTLLELQLFGHRLNYTHDSLPVDVFKPLKSLEVLHLRSDMSRFYGHQQPELPYQAISNIVQLHELNIDTTPNTVFQMEFSKLKNLNNLTLGTTDYKTYTYDCALSQITNDTFSVFNSSHILQLDLSRCNIQTFHSGCLKPLPYLQTFLFNDVYYYGGDVNDIVQAFEVYINKSMEFISIRRFRSEFLRVGGTILLVDIISQICISKLEISDADIIEINYDILLTPPFPAFTKCIKELNFRKNAITGKVNVAKLLLLPVMSNLQKFDQSLQQIFQINELDTMQAERPHIKRFPFGLPFIIPPHIMYIDVAGMFTLLGEMNDIFFFHGENVQYFNISFCSLYNFQHKIYGLPNLKVLDLSGNDLSTLNVDFFDTFVNLTHLRLFYTLLDNHFLIQSGSRLLSPLIKLEILDLSNNGLAALPGDIFNELKNLQMIVLTNNRLVSIPDVSSLMSLKHIHMGYNGLTTIDTATQHMLDRTSNQNSQFHISIYGNVFYCGCPSLSFLLWLNETRTQLDGRNYTCMDTKGEVTTTGLVMDDLIYLERQCSSPLWTSLASGGFSLTILLLVFGFVILKNQLKFQLFFLRLIGQNVYPKERSDFVNDVAVFPDMDSTRRFIHNELMVELKTKRGLKVDLGQLGRPETLNVVESIRDSWKIVLIVTKDFLASDVCLFTICNCLSAITLTTPNRIILLLDNQAIIQPNIHFLFEAISQTNIFHLDIQQSSGDDFWERVHARLIYKEPV